MKTPHLALAEIMRKHGFAYHAQYGKATFSEQRRVLRDIVTCRTAAFSGYIKRCDECGHTDVSYDSCRNPARWRDPKCQTAARAEWMEARGRGFVEQPRNTSTRCSPSMATSALWPCRTSGRCTTFFSALCPKP